MEQSLHDYLTGGQLEDEITIDYMPDKTLERMREAWHAAVLKAYNETSSERIQLRKEFATLPLAAPMSRNVLMHVQRYTDLSRHVDSHPHVIDPLADSLWEHVSIIVFG